MRTRGGLLASVEDGRAARDAAWRTQVIINGMTDAAYNELKGVRASWLKTLYSSTPAHLAARMDGEDEPSDALRVGRALHSLILEPDEHELNWTVAPKVDRRTTAGKETWAAFVARSAGKGVLDADEDAMIRSIGRSVGSTTASTLLGLCEHREVVLTGSIGGIECKAKIDACSSDGLLLDIKTCISAAPRAFTRSIVDFGYHLQMAFYRELMRQNDLGSDGATVLIACEKSAPFAVALYAIEQHDIARMAERIRPLLELFQRCSDTDEWPAYPTTVVPLPLPEWAFKEVSE